MFYAITGWHHLSHDTDRGSAECSNCFWTLTFRYPRVSGWEGAAVGDDDKPAEWSQGAAARGPLRAAEYGRSAAGEAAAADGAGSATAGAGTPHSPCTGHHCIWILTWPCSVNVAQPAKLISRLALQIQTFVCLSCLRLPNSSNSWYSSSTRSTCSSSRSRSASITSLLDWPAAHASQSPPMMFVSRVVSAGEHALCDDPRFPPQHTTPPGDLWTTHDVASAANPVQTRWKQRCISLYNHHIQNQNKHSSDSDPSAFSPRALNFFRSTSRCVTPCLENLKKPVGLWIWFEYSHLQSYSSL